MRLFKMLSVLAVVLFAASIVRADDTNFYNSGGKDPDGNPICGAFEGVANSDGVIDFTCDVVNGAVTSITDTASDSADGGSLNCGLSPLHLIDGWGVTSTINPGGTDKCILTAPTTVTWEVKLALLLTGDPYVGPAGDGDCDADDFTVSIPVGCALNVTNDLNGVVSPFSPGGAFGVAVPEPSSLSLLFVGLVGLPFARRKFAR